MFASFLLFLKIHLSSTYLGRKIEEHKLLNLAAPLMPAFPACLPAPSVIGRQSWRDSYTSSILKTPELSQSLPLNHFGGSLSPGSHHPPSMNNFWSLHPVPVYKFLYISLHTSAVNLHV